MFGELIELLKHAEEYEGCWRERELSVRHVVQQSARRKKGELEPGTCALINPPLRVRY
jgi:hypothetical protein